MNSLTRRWISLALGVFLFAVHSDADGRSEGKLDASLKKMFGDSVTISISKIVLTPEQQKIIFDSSHSHWMSDTIEAYVCSNENTPIGYGFLDNVKGKTQYITYLVGIGREGSVQDVDVLVYRESYGGEIAYDSFREQFRGKTNHDDVRIGKSIKNISGATISVRAITFGIRRILATFEIIRSRLH